MKKVLLTVLEPARATLLIGFAIGLGIAVHLVFFLAQRTFGLWPGLM